MMKKNVPAVTVAQMRKIDNLAIEQYGIPSLRLMENAGRAVAKEIIKRLKGKQNARAAIFCGMGNNAGDGFVIARRLMDAAIGVDTFLIGSPGRLKKDALENYKILKKNKHRVKSIKTFGRDTSVCVGRADIVVDAIFGTGLNRDVEEPFRGIIEKLNASGKPIISVDIPSGMDGTTGRAHGISVKADTTVTFACMKKGFLKKKAGAWTGKVVTADIGIPDAILKDFKR